MMKHNVILITIDSLRADRLSCLGYQRKITPNLDEIAGKGCLFSEAISVGSNTRISFPAIFASICPFILLHLPDKGYMHLPREIPTIAEVLNYNGYNTLAFNSNPLLTYYREYGRGFDICTDPLFERKRNRFYSLFRNFKDFYASKIRGEPFLPYPPPEKVNKRALSFLKNAKKPFFLWIHHMSIHVPYYPPKEFLREVSSRHISYSEMMELNKIQKKPYLVGKEDLSKIIDLYDAEVMNVDYYLGDFIKQLEVMDINFANTFFIITSDHGDELGEHGSVAHLEKLYDELIRVPLIIAGPGLNPRKITKQVSLLGLAPTILALTVNQKPSSFMGDDLLPLMRYDKGGEEYVISEGCEKSESLDVPRAMNKRMACRSHRWKYIYNEDGREELYDLLSDPQEKCNLRELESNLAEDLKKKISEHVAMEERVANLIKEKRRIRQRIRSAGINRSLHTL